MPRALAALALFLASVPAAAAPAAQGPPLGAFVVGADPALAWLAEGGAAAWTATGAVAFVVEPSGCGTGDVTVCAVRWNAGWPGGSYRRGDVPPRINVDLIDLEAGAVDARFDGTLEAFGAATLLNVNTPVFRVFHQSAAATTSTTNTVNSVNGGTLSDTLPAGTWELFTVTKIDLSHSTGGDAYSAISIDAGGDVGSVTLSSPSASWTTFMCAEARSGLSGAITVSVRFKSVTSGTTSARNPAIWLAARRTS